MKIAQHFSAGNNAINYSKAREAGDRWLTKRNSAVRFADSIIKYERDPSLKRRAIFKSSAARTHTSFLLLRYPLAGHLAGEIKIT